MLERIKGEYEEALFSKEEQLSNDPLLPSPLSHAVTATRDELEKSHLRVSKKEAELYKLYHGNKELQQQLSNQIRSLSDLEKQVRSYINININCRLRLIEPTVNWVKQSSQNLQEGIAVWFVIFRLIDSLLNCVQIAWHKVTLLSGGD